MQMAKSRNGNAAMMSIRREMPLSTQRPKKPAAMPASSPTVIATKVAVKPMTREVRAP